MNVIKVDSGFPLPPEPRGRPKASFCKVPLPPEPRGRPKASFDRVLRLRYPWDDMRVGDSFLVPGRRVEAVSSAAAHRQNASPSGRYTCRTVPGGVRVWRTA